MRRWTNGRAALCRMGGSATSIRPHPFEPWTRKESTWLCCSEPPPACWCRWTPWNRITPWPSAARFNVWVADYCREDPVRLKATTIVPQHDASLAAEEARRSVEELGSLGIVLLPMPIAGKHVHDAEFDLLWAELERLQVPACFHGTSGAVSKDYLGARLGGHPGYRTLSHASVFPLELMMAMGSMILGGVLERFPHLKVAFLEGNCSWLPWWLYRLDDQWEKFGAGETIPLQAKPSDYFQRQCFISMDADEYLAADMLARLGDDNVVFSTDYPHPDSAFPHAVEELLALEEISPKAKKKILWDNCARLYGL